MSRRASHSGALPSASVRLKARREEVIERWAERVCKTIPAARAQSESQLRNSLPKFLERLAAALSPERPRPVSFEDLNDVSQDHGRQRSTLEAYSLQQMLREYQVLREVIFALLEQEAPLTRLDRDIILSAIEEGMAEAGARFMDFVQALPKANEARLRETQEVLHLALESAQMGTWHIDLKGPLRAERAGAA
jgi:hypothetical protein